MSNMLRSHRRERHRERRHRLGGRAIHRSPSPRTSRSSRDHDHESEKRNRYPSPRQPLMFAPPRAQTTIEKPYRASNPYNARRRRWITRSLDLPTDEVEGQTAGTGRHVSLELGPQTSSDPTMPVYEVPGVIRPPANDEEHAIVPIHATAQAVESSSMPGEGHQVMSPLPTTYEGYFESAYGAVSEGRHHHADVDIDNAQGTESLTPTEPLPPDQLAEDLDAVNVDAWSSVEDDFQAQYLSDSSTAGPSQPRPPLSSHPSYSPPRRYRRRHRQRRHEHIQINGTHHSHTPTPPPPQKQHSSHLKLPGVEFTAASQALNHKPSIDILEETQQRIAIWKHIPRQIYLHFLLRLPSMYWHRLDKVFRDAYDAARRAKVNYLIDFTYYDGFSEIWMAFVEGLVKEWETLNIVSVLLLSVIFSIFQLDVGALTRTFAMLSLICALMSLLYGCTYIIRFGSVKRVVEARLWIKAIQDADDGFWGYLWNEWILLAMPAVWLGWSILLFIASLLFFVWRPNGSNDNGNLNFDLGSQVSVTVLLGLGTVYYYLVLWTFRVGWDEVPVSGGPHGQFGGNGHGQKLGVGVLVTEPEKREGEGVGRVGVMRC